MNRNRVGAKRLGHVDEDGRLIHANHEARDVRAPGDVGLSFREPAGVLHGAEADDIASLILQIFVPDEIVEHLVCDLWEGKRPQRLQIGGESPQLRRLLPPQSVGCRRSKLRTRPFEIHNV